MKKKSALVLNESSAGRIYGSREMEEIRELTDLLDGVVTQDVLESEPMILHDVELIFSGWGAPVFDDVLLKRIPKLEAVFYGAGSIRGIVTPEFWDSGITITSSWAANAVPVTEVVVAQITLSLKKFWQSSWIKSRASWASHPDISGMYDTKIGLISLGMIGRMVAERLKSYDVEVLAYDPFVNQETADNRGLGVRMVSLVELFSECDVVSLHTPNLPTTKNMITGDLILSMKQSATFINTARGAVVDETGLISALAERPDIFALLDVTDPEPPLDGSALYELPNVILSPHIAGSQGPECRRMGRYTIDQCRKYLAGEDLDWKISQTMSETMA